MDTAAKNRSLRVGILGAGRIGRIHTQILTRLGVKIVAIADPSTERGESLAREFGVSKFTTKTEDIFNDPSIHAVLICSPTDQHAQQIHQAAASKKHIFCEKPIALDLAIVDAAVNAVEAAGVKMMVGFNRRFDANFKRIRQAVVEGEIGSVGMVRITSRDPSAPPISYIKVSGGMFCDMTIHDFDMARFLVGAEVEQVYAMAQARDPEIGDAGDVDTAVICLKFANGVLGYIENSRVAAYGYDQRAEILGSKGAVSCENNYPNTVTVSTGKSIARDLPLNFFIDRYMEAYKDELEAFVEVCLNPTATPPVSGHDGRQALKLGLAATLSMKENRPVNLSEFDTPRMVGRL
ncbi:oxidoreductase family [Thraustotheca clavata]|uniref:Oxidoreductase family n=1 Tax=Thraustotheca clavata TaxID=74557 RepID=A0A1W0A5K2_9STRA|nr:oxidoreductase family [Thraustotheca clavata]